jgi:membrane associated rhomboid family serine protease
VTQDHTTAEAPVCYRHPDRNTLLRCSNCERPICAACSIDASVGQRCPECVREQGTQRVIPTTRVSRGAAAPATKAIIGITVLVYLAGFLLPAVENRLFNELSQLNVAVAAGEWWRIFTPVLLHASLWHIGFNMWALWVLGPQIERGVGTWPFIALYVAAAGAGGAFAFYMGDIRFQAVGASGAIFGLFGVWLSWALRRRNTMQGRALLQQILFLLVINAAIPVLIPGIAWQAHLGGLIGGFLVGEVWAKVRGPRTTLMRTVIALSVAVAAALAVAL